MRTLKTVIAAALACGAIQVLTTIGVAATDADHVTSTIQQVASIETGTSTQVLDLYRALDGGGPVTGIERSDLLTIFDKELAQAEDSVAKAKDAEARQIALANQDPQAAATVEAEDPDTLPSLIGGVDDVEHAATARLDALKSKDSVSIGDMFEMQLLMNDLSQLSEATTSVISASNTAIKSMAGNLRG
jgi:hypothetical protein